MKKIRLSRGVAAQVDDEDFERLSRFDWHAEKGYNTFYAVRRESMHREIMHAPDGMDVDHIDGDGLNNQKVNLRVVTRRVNACNHSRVKSSQYPGVSLDKRSKKWVARMKVKGKTKHLGLFSEEIDAARAYVRACEELLE